MLGARGTHRQGAVNECCGNPPLQVHVDEVVDAGVNLPALHDHGFKQPATAGAVPTPHHAALLWEEGVGGNSMAAIDQGAHGSNEGIGASGWGGGILVLQVHGHVYKVPPANDAHVLCAGAQEAGPEGRLL